MSAGVYMIKNDATGKSYFGISNSIEKRIASHFYSLFKGCHSVRDLQSDYDKYGKDNFSYRHLLHCTSSMIQKRIEMDLISNFGNNYNISKGGVSFNSKSLKKKIWSAGITMQQIADKASVSRQTASNVINGHYVNQIVIEAAETLLNEAKK